MSFAARLETELEQFKQDGVYKRLNYLEAPQAARTRMEGRGEVVILSSNNYLGLCNEPEVVAAGKRALDRYGAGTGSVRFICGTFAVHRELEQALARFVGCESSLTYVSCWNANEGLAPTLLGEQDIVISDQLNHASIIDSIRLAKAITKCQTAVYRHSDMADLEDKLRAARDARLKLVLTDGVFSMEGDIAKLPDIVALARKYDAIVAMDDSHGTGVLGRTGRGTAEHCGHHHVDSGQGARRRSGWLHGWGRSARRLPDPALPPAAVLERPAADRGSERPCRRPLRRAPARAGDPTPRQRPLLPRAAVCVGLQTASGGNADRSRHPG